MYILILDHLLIYKKKKKTAMHTWFHYPVLTWQMKSPRIGKMTEMQTLYYQIS